MDSITRPPQASFAPSSARPAQRGRPGHSRDDVVRAAVKEFNVRGFEATTMGHVAESLGVSKPALYHHIESKEAILEESVGRALDGLEAVWDEANSGDFPAVERLRILIDGAVEALSVDPEAVVLLLRLRGNSEVEKRALERRRRITRVVIELVSQAQEEGDIRDDVDASVVGRLLFGLVNSLAEWFRVGGRLGADDIARTLNLMFFEGVRSRL